MKRLFLSTLICLVTFALVGSVQYEAGYELVSKKRTTPAVLYFYKNDLIKLLDSRVFLFDGLDYGKASARASDLYQIEKGDKIRLLESLRNGEIFKVQLLTNNKKGKYYYFIETKSLKHFSLVQTEISINK